ncbi:MAG: family 16 glycoside hydrolase, partial [Limisphaerales bacterium]
MILATVYARGAEHTFDFSEMRQHPSLPGFRSAVTGKGKPGEWKIILDEVAPMLAPLTTQATGDTRQAVLAQLAQDPTDEHFPLLIYEDEIYGDFTLTTRIKLVKGVMEQMAGIAFRVQNETNYYVVRASALGNTFKFYKVLNGERGPLVGPEMPIAAGVWHQLTVSCKGNQIRCSFDGKEYVSVTDKANAIASGKIAFWTKSDAVSYFTDAKITYTPFAPPAQALVRDMLKRYPRLLGLKIYVPGNQSGATRIVASKDDHDLGEPGTKTEQEVITRAETYYGMENDVASVIMPLRDRNGDPIAAVRVIMKSFPGQTEENAIVRAAPIVKQIQ